MHTPLHSPNAVRLLALRAGDAWNPKSRIERPDRSLRTGRGPLASYRPTPLSVKTQVPIRVRAHNLLGMTDEALARVVNGISARPHGNCTDLYRWLRAHHDKLAAELEAHRPSWTTVARGIEEAGITGRFGAPLTARTVRRVWVTVCRDVAAATAAAELERMTRKRAGSKSYNKKLH